MTRADRTTLRPRLLGVLEILAPGLLALAMGTHRLFGERWFTDTAYYQAIALKASREGFWWSLREGEVWYFNKPPAAFWMHALCAKVFGEGDWQSKLPELACFALVSVLVGVMARRWGGGSGGRAAGLAAGVLMASAWEWAFRVGNFRLDFHHTLFMLGFCACAMRAVEAPGRSGTRWTIAGGAFLGLALLTKQFFALTAPALMLAWVLVFGRERARGARVVMWATLVGAAMAAPWHLGMSLEHGRGFWEAYLLAQSVDRALGTQFDPEPWWWYFAYFVRRDDNTIAWATWPMSTLALIGSVMVLRALGRGGAARRSGMDVPAHERAWNRLGAFALLWTLAWLVLLSAFGDKRNYYALVLHPGLAMLGGLAVGRWIDARSALARWVGASAAVLSVVGVVGVCASVAMRERVRQVVPPNAGVAGVTDWLRRERPEVMYNAGLRYNDAALFYVKGGVWPRSRTEKRPVARADIPARALALYDTSPGRPGMPIRPEPDARDEEVFRSGRFVVMRIRE